LFGLALESDERASRQRRPWAAARMAVPQDIN
jgi:hypothetical protein